MVKNLDPSTSKILIIGGGTWGTSTALHLARRGYKHIKVLDAYQIPSPIAAGNDINKIVEEGARGRTGHHSPDQDQDDDTWAMEEVRIEATRAWKSDPVFRDFCHETGYVISASSEAAVEQIRESERPSVERGYVELTSAEAFRRTMPEGVLTGEFPGWKGWFKATGSGWVHARKGLVAAAEEARRLGVEFVCGESQGRVVEIIMDSQQDVQGARTADGVFHRADHTILSAGANADALIDMQNQLRPTAWTLAHIRMTPSEAELYRHLPVLFNVERGFFMEPDEDNLELKICDEHPGYCNLVRDERSAGEWKSVPFARRQIPLVSEEGIRGFLRDCIPQLAEREFCFARICWCADTPNRSFLISKHPEHRNLTLAVGDSGHGFMHITVIGKYIADCMEGKLDARMLRSWRWRPETAVNRDWADTQGRHGGPGVVRDFQNIAENEWTEIIYPNET